MVEIRQLRRTAQEARVVTATPPADHGFVASERSRNEGPNETFGHLVNLTSHPLAGTLVQAMAIGTNNMVPE